MHAARKPLLDYAWRLRESEGEERRPGTAAPRLRTGVHQEFDQRQGGCIEVQATTAGRAEHLTQAGDPELGKECETFHEMECEQIHWCRSFVAADSASTCSRIETFEHEIERLQYLCQLDKTRLKHMTDYLEQLNRVEANARARAEASKEGLASATRAATERVVRANKAVLSSEPYQTKLISLHQELQQEMKDLASYMQELLKALAVDCHAAYLGAGKFLAIQSLKAETNQGHPRAPSPP
jgi:hypothetical protein